MTLCYAGWLSMKARRNAGFVPRIKALGVCFAFAAAFVTGRAEAQTAPQLNGNGDPDDRVVLVTMGLTANAEQYVNQAHPRVMRIRIISNSLIDPDHDLKPDWDLINNTVQNWYSPGYNGVICLDWEAEFFEALKGGPEHENFQKAINKGIALVNYIKNLRPNAKIGYYGIPNPNWNVDPAHLAPLVNALDVMLPAVYMSDLNTYQQNVTKLLANIQFAMERANGRPVVAFHSPRLAARGGIGGDDIVEREQFIEFVQKTFTVEYNGKRPSGIVIWDMTGRWLSQGILSIIDSEYVPAGMNIETYATEVQRYFVCTAMEAVIPDLECGQPMPGTELVTLPDPPIVPPASDGGGTDGSGAGVLVGLPQPIIVTDSESDPSRSLLGGGASGGAGETGPATGVNLAPLDPQISGWTFTNFLWVSSPWQILPADNQAASAETSEFGYPVPGSGQVAQTIVGAGMKSILPPGKWLCLYNGQGDIEFSGDATFLRESQGRILFRVHPTDNGVRVRFSDVHSGDPLRNVRVIPFHAVQGAAGSPTLHPQVVNRLRAENHQVLRFTSWQKIDGSSLEHWSDRPTREHVSQISERGAAVELMIELCNTLDYDAWFSIPAMANDEFVRSFADLVDQKLEQGRKVYVEYATDVLDPSRPQFSYAAAQGAALAPGATEEEAAAKYHAKRSREIIAIWREAFALQPHRLVGVLGVPGNQPEAAAIVLADTAAMESADMIGVSGGIGGAALTREFSLLSSGLTIDGIVSMLVEARESRMPRFIQVASMVAATGKPMAVLNSGAGLLANADGLNAQLIKQLRKAELDPRTLSMSTAEREFWADAGAVLILADDRPDGAP